MVSLRSVMTIKKIAAAVAAILVIGCIALIKFNSSVDRNANDSAASLIDSKTIASLPKSEDSPLYLKRVAQNMKPPTNKWYSGAVLQEEPKAIFPMPLAVKPSDKGFSYNLPQVQTTEKTISAPFVPDVTVEIENAQYYRLTRYDELSFDLTYYDDKDGEVAVLKIAAGSPYIFLTTISEEIIQTNPDFKSSAIKLKTQTKDGKVYGMSGSWSGFDDQDSRAMTVPSRETISFFAGSQDNIKQLANVALNRVMKTDVGYMRTDTGFKTSLHYMTENDEATYVVAMPHQKQGKQSETLSYDSVYGPLTTKSDKTIEYETKDIAVTARLDLREMDADQKKQLIDQLRRDINATRFAATDTYFGGKELYRAAQLLELAEQLNEKQLANSIRSDLTDQFDMWLSAGKTCGPKAFCVDEKIGGLVGGAASFGSDEFNDHHFHYGYFIYAAAIVAQYDDTFKDTYGDMINLLVADIANYKTDEEIPLRRSFDTYAGHSWASGASPFDDGNNQESSSEAANAWIGVSLWAQQTGNDYLKEHAEWLLSNEVSTAQIYWLLNENTPATSYEHSVVSLNWGSKRDYATWFSPEPSAILGIQLIPMSPTMLNYLSHVDDLKIKKQVDEVSRANPNGPLSDYVKMYAHVAGSRMNADEIASLKDELIDGGNSKSYMMAWFLSK